MLIKRPAVFICIVVLSTILFFGCEEATLEAQKTSVTIETEATTQRSEESTTGIQEALTTGQNESIDSSITVTEGEATEIETVTPYQFLFMICGNAEELSFTYGSEGSGGEVAMNYLFQRRGLTSVATFKALDMNGNTVAIRELEKDGKVHYIMDDSGVIRTYLAPAHDYLLYEMIEAAKTTPDRVLDVEGYVYFEHSLPFIHDETMAYHYGFYMKDNTLKKLKLWLDDREPTVYLFSDFEQRLVDPKAFDYPSGYQEASFEYENTGEHMPPWWEIGNDQ